MRGRNQAVARTAAGTSRYTTGHGTPPGRCVLHPSESSPLRDTARSSDAAMHGNKVDSCGARRQVGRAVDRINLRRTARGVCERARSGSRAHGSRYEAVVQGMELSDVRIQIAGRRRQIGVAQPQRDGVHRITGF